MKTCEITITKQPDGLFKATLEEGTRPRAGVGGTHIHTLKERFESADSAAAAAKDEANKRGLAVNRIAS